MPTITSVASNAVSSVDLKLMTVRNSPTADMRETAAKKMLAREQKAKAELRNIAILRG
jgi:hypothetical protein